MKAKEIFDNVVGKVVNEAKSEMLNDLKNTYSEALERIEYMKRETSAKASEIPLSQERQAETLNRRIIGGTELSARNSSLQLFEETIKEVFEKSLKKLSNPSSIKGYEESLRRYLEEGIEAIGDVDYIIISNSKDTNILKRISEELEKKKGVKIKLSEEKINCRGGVQIINNERTVIFDNTIETRIERLKSILRKEIAEIITK